MRLRLFPVFAFIFAVVSLQACDSPADEMNTPKPQVIKTLQGQVTGAPSEFASDVNVYKGLPYAEPPVGNLRWKPPTAAKAWQGIRAATEFSLSCSQPTHTSTFVWRREDFATAEDCLYLNIWAQAEAKDLPVMVWFHGGAHTSGQGHSKIFDGTTLAQSGVILVSINYRLGPLGFLAHPWLTEESHHASSGNYGLLDKIAALNWIRDNIAQFGGDPNNVTIFGQSAGSQSVCSLMTSPLAEGLFHKAIGQSAACVGPAPRQDADGTARGTALAAATGAKDLNQLRDLTPAQLLAAAEQTGWANASRIVIDGWIVPEPQVDSFKRGAHHHVPLLLGSLANEGVELFPRNDALTQSEFDQFTQNIVGEFAQDLASAYADDLANSPGHAHHAISTDLFMTFGMRRWAEYSAKSDTPTYLYFMDHVPPAFHLYMPENPLLELDDGPRGSGAYHSGDLAYVFGNTRKVGLDWDELDHKLSGLMVQYWSNFAKQGDPNGPGLPLWPTFTQSGLETQLLRPSAESSPGVRNEALAVFAKANPL